MQIFVNNKIAAIKKGSSFEYISENRMFSGADAYSLEITFPLAGCPQNIDIFGHINRADVSLDKLIFDCEIRDLNFSKFGVITIININESEVKAQFLEGRSEQNFNESFDNIFINALSLGDCSDCIDSTPELAWDPVANNYRCVALPWVNDETGNIQNLAVFNQQSGSYDWDPDCSGRSWMPYLLYISKQICRAVGYASDFSQWENNDLYKNIIICNALPSAWDCKELATALPKWSVAEYFEKLELFLNGEFTIDHKGKKISFAFTDRILTDLKPVRLDNVVDEHSTNIQKDGSKCEYMETKNISYSNCDHAMWKFYACDWFISNFSNKIITYPDLNTLIKENRWLRDWNGSSARGTNMEKILYAADVDTYFVIRSIQKILVTEYPDRPNQYKYKTILQPVNSFGGRIVSDEDDSEEEEIEFVPAWIDETEEKYGPLVFLQNSGFNDNGNENFTFDEPTLEDYKDRADANFAQSNTVKLLEAGEQQNGSGEFFDKIYVAWWNGDGITKGLLPHPCVENVEVVADWSGYRTNPFSFRLAGNSAGHRKIIHRIDTKVRKTFKFISDTIPDVRAVFIIKGKRYIAEKISATFSENGMSELLSIDVWPIDED